MLKIIILPFFMLFIIGISSHAIAEDPSEYQSAIINTALHNFSTAENPLTTIAGARVRMVVFTTYDGYQTSDTTLGANIWTTVAPDVKQLCRQYVNLHKHTLSHAQLNLWLAQLLGLAAKNAEQRHFVELDIPVIQAYYGPSSNERGIFRPCTDPRIGLHSDATPICPPQMNAADNNISSDYKTWFINTTIAAHTLENGMPWTEHGYTYNWNPQANNTLGVAEFVVLKGTPITVLANPNNAATAYVSSEEYCSMN